MAMRLVGLLCLAIRTTVPTEIGEPPVRARILLGVRALLLCNTMMRIAVGLREGCRFLKIYVMLRTMKGGRPCQGCRLWKEGSGRKEEGTGRAPEYGEGASFPSACNVCSARLELRTGEAGRPLKISFAVWEKERYWILTRQYYDSVTRPV